MQYSGKKIYADLQNLVGIPDLTDWEKGFINSIQKNYSKWGGLTEGQHRVFQKLVTKYSEENIKKASTWDERFSDGMKADFMVMVDYYRANPPYFQSAITSVDKDENYMPTEKLWRSMCENKYAKRVLVSANTPPAYPAGSLIKVRDTRNITPGFQRFRGKTAVVINYEQGIHSAAKGAKRLTILPVGSSIPIQIEERWLKPEKSLRSKNRGYPVIQEGEQG